MFRSDGLQAGYGKISVLRGVDFEVHAGEIVGLLGRNGVGKSTTLKAIMGLVPSSGGTMTFNGNALSGKTPHAIPHLGIGYVPQGRGIFGALTVWENLCLGLRRDPSIDELQDSVFVRFPRLKERLEQPAGTLSGGEQQMLAIARCIVMQPTLMLMDEPTEGVMPLLVKSIQNEIRSINRSGVAVLLVEQNVKAAARLCDRIYIMEKGRVIHHEIASAYRDHPEILSAHMGFATTAADQSNTERSIS